MKIKYYLKVLLGVKILLHLIKLKHLIGITVLTVLVSSVYILQEEPILENKKDLSKNKYVPVTTKITSTSGSKLTHTGIVSSKVTFNHKYKIETRTILGEEPEVFIIDNEKKVETQLTNNEITEYSPAINNKGQYAYATTEYSSRKAIVLNGKVLLESNAGVFYDKIDMDDNNLAFIIRQSNKRKKDTFSVFNLNTNKYQKFIIDGYVDQWRFLNTKQIVIQYFSLTTMSNDIICYNIDKKSIVKIATSVNDEILKNVNYNNSFSIMVLDNQASNLKLLFNAIYNYKKVQYGEALSFSNNFMGFLAWNQSYRLESLSQLYMLSGNKNILLDIKKVFNNFLQTNNEKLNIIDKYNHKFSYASKKYSLNKNIPITFMVHDGRIYYSLLSTLNTIGPELNQHRDQVVNRFESLFNYYENFYIGNGLYIFPKGLNFWADGVWLPYNQQNIFALAVLELYKLTKKNIYKNRVFEMAKKFKQDFVYSEDYLTWYYWPDEYYNGWEKEDNRSINTPSRNKREKEFFEDTSHAGTNVEFILEFQKQFPNEVFLKSDIQKMTKTINTFVKKDKFSRFMNDQSTAMKDHYSYIPFYGWSKLNNQKLNHYYYSLNPIFGQHWLKYLSIDKNNLEEYKEYRVFKYNLKYKKINTELKKITKDNLMEVVGD